MFEVLWSIKHEVQVMLCYTPSKKIKVMYSIKSINPRTLHNRPVSRGTIYCCIVTTVKAQEKILPEVGFTTTSNGSTQASYGCCLCK